MKLTAELQTLYKKGREDPVFFVHNVVAMSELWGKQKEIMYSVRDNPRTCVRSCNGAGKTFVSANVVAWFLATHPNSIVITTAPTARQVRELLWQEINNLHANSKYPLGGRTLQTSWTVGAKWFALGLSTDDPNRFQGFHAEHILGVIDEGAGVDAPIYEAMDAILTSSNARLLTIGNPTEASGRFYDAFSSPLYNKIHISAFDTPNFQGNGVIYPALITPQWAEERRMEWGEESPAYQARVLGNFPIIGTDTMIPLGWVLKATERDIAWGKKDLCVMAVDSARFGDDESAIAVRRGMSLARTERYTEVDTVKLSRHAQKVAEEEKPDIIVVDAVGIGAGVADNLRSWGLPAVDFISQGKAWEPQRFVNRRTEAWFRVRELFRRNEIAFTRDEMLVGQLTAPKYRFDTSGRYVLESKEDMRKRGLMSPDRADAFVMAFDCTGSLKDYADKTFEVERHAPNTVGAIFDLLTQADGGDEYDWATMIS